MAAHYLIIDGYNLMHAAGIARRSYGRGDLERCRNQLNRLLTDLLGRNALSRTSIVYDAFDSTSDANRSQDHAGLHVLFAPKGTDADTEIERLLNRHSSPKQVLVVSSDHRLHKAARRRKANCVDSEDFLAGIQTSAETDTRQPEQRRPPQENTSHEAVEVQLQSWADEFEGLEDQADPTSEGRAFTDEYLKDIQRELDDEKLP
ncbi:MAG: NYN domain-containing protein [Fuerstiella sp.]